MDKCVGPDFFQLRQITACRSWGFCKQVPGRKTESETKKEPEREQRVPNRRPRRIGDQDRIGASPRKKDQRGAAAEQSRAEGAEHELFAQAPHARPIR